MTVIFCLCGDVKEMVGAEIWVSGWMGEWVDERVISKAALHVDFRLAMAMAT